MPNRVCVGVDFGGSSIRLAAVDVQRGRCLGEMLHAATPQPATPAAVFTAIEQLLAQCQRAGHVPQTGLAVGVGYPGVVRSGMTLTASNIDATWLGLQAETALADRLQRDSKVRFLNDADAAGLAEMHFGSGRGLMGLTLVLTFGTGIGSAPFIDGRLVPNTELGHLQLAGQEIEAFASGRARSEGQLSFDMWCERVNLVLAELERLFWPDTFIVGGALSEHFAEFAPLLRARANILPAQLAGAAGVVGAAYAAHRATELT